MKFTRKDIEEQIKRLEEDALKMEKYLPIPKTDFLYFNFEEGNYLQYKYRRNLFYGAFDEQEEVFDESIKSSSLDALIYLFVYIHKDTYPRDEFRLRISLDSNTLHEKKYTVLNGREITESTKEYYDFFREDIKKMEISFYSESYTDHELLEKHWSGWYHIQELLLEFNAKIPLDAIEVALEKKDYKKTEEKGVITYLVVDSPIASLEVKENSIKITINENKIIKYKSFR